MTRSEDLKKLQEIQEKYMGVLDINIETRNDQQKTMFTMTNYPCSKKLYIYKLNWYIDNTKIFDEIYEQINKLNK